MTWPQCSGRVVEYVSGHKSRHWWRCRVCRWVGWSTTAPTIVPTIGAHAGHVELVEVEA